MGRSVAVRAIGLAVALLAGCGALAPSESGSSTGDGRTPGHPSLRWCTHTPFAALPARGWAHLGSSAVAALGPPGHSAQDVITTPGTAMVLQGKFAYGLLSQDLAGEAVRVFLDDCGGWRDLGEQRTDSDGRVRFAVGGTLPVGVYAVRFEVMGDESLASGRIWVLPAGTRLAISDIDGTLTTSDGELVQDVVTDLFAPIFSGEHVPEAYPGAVELISALENRGLVPVYLTGRPYWLTERTRGWLASLGFAAGALHTTDSNAEALPTETGVGAYKLAFLQQLVAAGFVLEEAYGNATTDISAYLGVGLGPEQVWIIGAQGGARDTHAVAGSWQPRVEELHALPKVEQPFE